jgi:hypothetical protein
LHLKESEVLLEAAENVRLFFYSFKKQEIVMQIVFKMVLVFSFWVGATLFAESGVSPVERSEPDSVLTDSLENREFYQKMYMNYLKEEGFTSSVDNDGDVQFQYEGKTYFIEVNEKDPEFFRVVLPNIWPIESPEEEAMAIVAAEYSTDKTKVVKTILVKDNVWLSAESFVKVPEDFQGIFKRTLSAIQTSVGHYVEKMEELQQD